MSANVNRFICSHLHAFSHERSFYPAHRANLSSQYLILSARGKGWQEQGRFLCTLVASLSKNTCRSSLCSEWHRRKVGLRHSSNQACSNHLLCVVVNTLHLRVVIASKSQFRVNEIPDTALPAHGGENRPCVAAVTFGLRGRAWAAPTRGPGFPGRCGDFCLC